VFENIFSYKILQCSPYFQALPSSPKHSQALQPLHKTCIISTVAERYPQIAYDGFAFCLQNEWQYVQRVIADTAPFVSLLEAAIRTSFLPALLGIPSLTEIDGEYRQLLTHSVRLSGLAIRNPVDTAPSVHMALLATTRHLTASLGDDQLRFDLGTRCACAIEAGLAAQQDQLLNEQIFLDR
jgi:hypothetical protein